MAITTTTIAKAAGWARTDVIDQLEQAFTWLGLHGSRISGLVTSISSYSGGGTVGSGSQNYWDVPVATTTGIGTGATFDITRSIGNVNLITVNRPGYGYTDGEYVTLSAEDIGGAANGAVAIGITVNIDPVGYGSTNQFFDKNFTPSGDSTRPWGVLKQDFDTNKRFGVTYRGFKVYDDYRMSLYAGSSFYPFDRDNVDDRGGQRRDTFRGTVYLDIPNNASGFINLSLNNTSSNSYAQIGSTDDAYFSQYATTNSPTSHNLNLNIYRSGLDPNFAVLSFNQPLISGTINESTFMTLIIHNFNSNLWDLDEVFSAGITFINPQNSINQNQGDTAVLTFSTALSASNSSDNALTTRTAESGWAQIYGGTRGGTKIQVYSIASSQTDFTGSVVVQPANNHPAPNEATTYTRIGGLKDTGIIEGEASLGNRYPIASYNAVIKGIPINGNLIPCPYYMPDDFVLIDFKLTASGQDIKQGDTVTISGSEVYTVITGSYNKFGETAGILFCARTV